MNTSLEIKLKNYLNLFWLRPENGLMCAFKSKVFDDLAFKSPSLDISCSDGLFMFLHLGGEFGVEFDIFNYTKAKEFSHSSFVDIYDSFNERYEPKIIKVPTVRLDFGTDWKQGLLNRADKLGLYDKLLLHDNNFVPLPLPEDHFRTIYSNSIYWVKDVESLLRDVYRMLKPGGIAVLEMITPYLLQTLDELEKYLSAEAIAILNRQRRETMPAKLEYRAWVDLMKGIGFKVEDIRNVYPNKILIDIWNIGFRPVSHLLVEMADSLSNENRSKIKTEWVDILYKLFSPLLTIEETYSLEKAPYLCFYLTK